MTNRLVTKPVAALLAAVCVIVSPYALASSAADADGPVQVLTNLQFSATALGTDAMNLLSSSATHSLTANSTTLSMPGWLYGAHNGGSLLLSTTTTPVSNDSSYALEAVYPATTAGGQYTWADYSVASLNTDDVYIEFWAKMPDAKEGLKFLKIFGKMNDPEGYARVTFGVNYTDAASHGGIPNVEFGDGTATVNDGQNAIRFNGTYPQWIGRSYGTAKVLTPQMNYWPASNWGTSWHHFRVHVRFNSGTTSTNEIPNGELYFEIDGKVYVDATGLYDRNPANGLIDYVEFGGWAQTDPEPFDVWFDNITISTGGFVSSPPPPMPPANVALKQ